MGRFFANGIPIKFSIYCKDQKDDKDFDVLKQHLSRYFNLDFYDIDTKSFSDEFILTIKKDLLENHIHQCLIETHKITRLHTEYMFSNPDVGKMMINDSKDFCQENYPITFQKSKYRDDEFCLKYEKDEFNEAMIFYEPFWLYWDNDLLGRDEKYRIDMDVIQLWSCLDKIDSEDETYLLFVVNNMKKSFYKNPLAQNIVYFICG